jgi:antitoxin VapB
MYICTVYTNCGGAFMSKTRIFKSGNSQAVRLPKQFRFHVDEVEILRRGNEIVLREPKRNLGQAFVALGAMPEDFMADGRKDQAPQKRDSL